MNSDDTTIDSSQTSSDRFPTTPNTVMPYVDFSGYYAEVEKARLNGDLPDGIDFF